MKKQSFRRLVSLALVAVLLQGSMMSVKAYGWERSRIEEIEIVDELSYMEVGESVDLDVDIYPSSASSDYLFWMSSNPAVADVDESGYLTAKKAGETTITVYAGWHSDSFKLTVGEKNAEVYGIDILDDDLLLAVGDSYTLKAETYPDDAKAKFSWKSSDKSVVSVDRNGKLTARKEGYAYISVSYAGYEDDIYVEVIDDELISSITVTGASKHLDVGDELQLYVDFYPSYAYYDEISWSSSNNRIASVDADGLVTAKKEGTATITAKAYNGKSADYTVYVGDQVAYIEIEYDSKVLRIDDSMLLDVDFYPTYPDNDEITWTTSNKWVATVDKYGEVYGWHRGKATITAEARNGMRDSIEIQVVDEYDDAWYEESDEEFVERGKKLYYYIDGDAVTSRFIVLDDDDDFVESIRYSKFDFKEIDSDYTVYFANEDGEILRNRWIILDERNRFVEDVALDRLKLDKYDSDYKIFLADDEGALGRSWIYADGHWYFMKDTYLPLKEGWVASKSDWYMIKDFVMKKNAWIPASNGRWYYVDEQGKMVRNRKVNGCWINSYGIYWSPTYSDEDYIKNYKE